MSYGNKRILVTGMTGLIGKELIEPLKNKGFEIYAITIEEPSSDNGIFWIKGNLFDENFIRTTMEKFKPSYLLNMAWTTVGDYLSSDINYSFLIAGINLLKYFHIYGGKRAIYVGTCFEYEFSTSTLSETTPLNTNKSVYTFCKNKLNECAEYFCKTHDISYGYGRIFYVYGHNEDKSRLTGMILHNLSNNQIVEIKNADLIKDYIYSKDIANAFVEFIDSSVEGIVNICSGEPITIGDYASLIAKKMSKENLLILKNEPSTQPKSIVGDNSRLVNEVCYRPKYTLEQGIDEILKNYQKV